MMTTTAILLAMVTRSSDDNDGDDAPPPLHARDDSDSESSNDESEDEEELPEEPAQLGRGHRIRVPTGPMLTSKSFKGQTQRYEEGVTRLEDGGMQPEIANIRVQVRPTAGISQKALEVVLSGCVMDGVAPVSFEKEGSVAPPTAMSEEESDSHVVGLTLAQQHSLKKGLTLFGDAGDQTVEKELSSIHNMDTYEPLIAKDLSYKDK